MKKIEVIIYPQGGIDCNSPSCSFRRECANHRTAGDFRTEDGFTPEMTERNGEYFCETIDRDMADSDDPSFRNDFPENYDNLSRGALTVRDLELASCNNFQI